MNKQYDVVIIGAGVTGCAAARYLSRYNVHAAVIERAEDGREMTVELKSVNHRYLDLSFRMPRHISFAEDTLRTALNDSLSRGHVDVYVNYRNTRSDAKEVRIDTALLGAYLKSVKAAAA